jgi:hypothetical protein
VRVNPELKVRLIITHTNTNIIILMSMITKRITTTMVMALLMHTHLA